MALAKKNYRKVNKQPINNYIKAEKVRLISSEGEQLGIKKLEDALELAKKETLDLVQLSDNQDIPVCKLMNYGKHLFDKKKQKSASKKKQKKTQVKEIKFRPGTEENDYQIKLKSIIKFLGEGDKAKITMRFRGREMAHQTLGATVLDRVKEDTEDLCKVETLPKLEGRQMVMILAPK